MSNSAAFTTRCDNAAAYRLIYPPPVTNPHPSGNITPAQHHLHNARFIINRRIDHRRRLYIHLVNLRRRIRLYETQRTFSPTEYVRYRAYRQLHDQIEQRIRDVEVHL